jgi:hypothetical protein
VVPVPGPVLDGPDGSAVSDTPPMQVLRPGDRVLVVPHSGMPVDELPRMGDLLRARFPDVEFTILDAATVLVQPGSPETMPTGDAFIERYHRESLVSGGD